MKKKRRIIVSIIVVIVICIIGYGVYSYKASKSEVNNTSNKSQDYTNEANSNKNTTEKDNKNYSSKEPSNQNSTSSKEDSNQKNVSSNNKNITQLNNQSSKSSNSQNNASSNNQTNKNQINKSVNNNNNTSSNNNSNNNDEAYKKRLKALSGKYQEMESNLLDKYGHNKYGLITPGPGPETTKLETSYYNDWNDVLNSVWGDLKANLPESQMKNLTKQEVEWINSKDGKDIGEQGQMTRDRAVYLLKKYIYQIS